ncbi:short-chain dehydrogenase/reductase [Metarhizium anisopliae]
MSTRQSALVTGASRGGLGDALAQELHARGFRVFATARTLPKVQHLKDLGMEVVKMDVADSTSIRNAVAQVASLAGNRLDILINNAGTGYQSTLLDADIETARQLFNVNVFGVLDVTQAFGPMLIASKGIIVNAGSVLGRVPMPFCGVYNASKAALDSLSKQMRIELAPFDIRVVHVNAGGIQSDFLSHAAGPKGLPDKSPYYAGHGVLNPWISGEITRSKYQPTRRQDYAKSVVDAIVKHNPPSCLWTGYSAWVIWFTTSFLWRDATDLMMWAMGAPDIKVAMSSNE